MHIARIETRSLDEAAEANDLGQSAAELVFLSFTDSDLAAFASAYDRWAAPRPSMRVANLAALKHPYSVDLYLEKVCVGAKVVLVRLLGGMDYWRYGVEQLAVLARARGFKLALLPGDRLDDPRLVTASTVEADELARLWRYFDQGGPENMAACLAWLTEGDAPEARALKAFGLYKPSRRALRGNEPAPLLGGRVGEGAPFRDAQGIGNTRGAQPPAYPLPRLSPAQADGDEGSPRALLMFYRSIFLADDLAPIDALDAALRERGFATTCAYVTSLKDAAAASPLSDLLRAEAFDIVLNTTAFAARGDSGGVLDEADAPVFQVVLSSAEAEPWAASSRGLSPSDLAMNVALPEVDGRILTRAISFKQAKARDEALQFARVVHAPIQDRVDYVADLARRWADLRRTPRAARKLACVLSDYPAKGGRVGYAVGLDTPASVEEIARSLRGTGYAVDDIDASRLIAHLSQGSTEIVLSLAQYREHFAALPEAFRASVNAAWADPPEQAFAFRIWRAGNLIVAVQPDRGRLDARKDEYHDLALAPRHAYVAFYIWLREVERIDAMIHLGAHGTLEWLPGKAVALSRDCAVEATLGAMPVVYPFIVNNPGEAAQAKRRLGAVTIGHMTPPLVDAGAHGAAREVEALFDEFSQAQSLDPRRARLIGELILSRADEVGLLRECEADNAEPEAALRKLDAWLCELKDMRIGDGMHVFGGASGTSSPEVVGLLRALDGGFVAPGPAGAPSRGRLDVLPTGRNLYAIDPRGVPTRNAWEIGRRAAEEVVVRYAQDHGEWPRRIVLDLWGSASMRTGGEEIAQAFAFIGARPVWDHASSRVNAFEVLPLAMLERPRVAVTVRISGLFRDVFPTQIALLNAAFRAVSALEESIEENPFAGDDGACIFGPAPERHGVGIGGRLASGDWETRQELGRAYLGATGYAYDGAGAGRVDGGFSARVANADALVHVQDMVDQDVLDSDAYAEHEGGFAAAAAMLGGAPEVYHIDATAPETVKVRRLEQEVARVLRGRAINPRWIAGQMRHGHRGAAEIAETLDNVFAYAALTDVVTSSQFDLYFDATLGDDDVRAFLIAANPLAAQGMAAKFDEARRRGFWDGRRNSHAAILSTLLAEAA
jgi:cobaltochelatase CobN